LRLKKKGKKKMKKGKIILPIVMLLLLIVATIGVTFAAFTFSREGQVENIIESSTIMLTYTEGKTGIILNEAYPMSDERGKILTGENNVFDFTVTATLGKSNVIGYEVTAIKTPITDMTPLEDNEIKLYLERAIDPDTSYQEIFAPSNFVPRDNQTTIGSPVGSMIIDAGTFTTEGTTIHNYRLRLWVDENAQILNGETRKYGIKVNVYAKQDVYADSVEQLLQGTNNASIKKIFTYNQTTGADNFCVTGEEETCTSLRRAPATYEAGTIIKYKVNETEEKYFHVVSDNGDTLTLQQRENLVYQTEWYAGTNDNTNGPTTILSALESATANWTNVLDQTYTLGSTTFKDNAYTGCAYEAATDKFTCATNTYILGQRIAKARMITVQEAHALGCLGWEIEGSTNGSCPVWIYNYLTNATNYGGIVSDGANNYGYWTMNANSSGSTNAWRVDCSGNVGSINTALSNIGARPVVVVQK